MSIILSVVVLDATCTECHYAECRGISSGANTGIILSRSRTKIFTDEQYRKCLHETDSKHFVRLTWGQRMMIFCKIKNVPLTL